MRQRYKVKLDSAGRLTLPEGLRKLLNMGPGDVIAFEIEPNGVRIRL